LVSVIQITNTTTITSGTSIIDAIRTQAATLAASTTYNMLGKKMTLYINPLGLDYLEAEAKNSATMMRYIQSDTQEVMAGLTVDSIRTALGAIPIIPEPFLIKNAYGSAAPAGTNNYPFALVCEDLIEYHYIGSKTPRVFQMGTLANLNESYVGILFGAPVVKSPGYAHVLGNIQR